MLSFGVPDDADGARRGKPIKFIHRCPRPRFTQMGNRLFYLETRKPGKIHGNFSQNFTATLAALPCIPLVPVRSIQNQNNSWFHDETSLFHRRSPSGFAVHLTRPTRSIHGFQIKSLKICGICVICGSFLASLESMWIPTALTLHRKM
jgi:hypothetical protein